MADNDRGLKDPMEFLRQVLIANDTEYKLWPEQEVRIARNGLIRLGGIPPPEVLHKHFGKEPFDEAMAELVRQREQELKEGRARVQFRDALRGTDSPCVACGATTDLTHHEFGLARITKTERDWKSVGISAAISAATLPLLGAGALYGPGKSQTANVLRMNLVLCKSCVDKRRGFLGGYLPKAGDCSSHPLWKQLQEAGFTKFLDEYELRKWH
jgi:hypothetical protein